MRTSAGTAVDQRSVNQRLIDHVERIAVEHPPVDLQSVDYTVLRPRELEQRFGGVFDYMARAELEVQRNVLELQTLLPDPPEVDRTFIHQVWGPQETHHGLILDELQTRIGRPPVEANLTEVPAKIRILGALAHLGPIQDVVRMLYYLTGMGTERSAVLAYHLLEDGVAALGERAVVETVIRPIRRQEPSHFAFYRMSAEAMWARLSPWQRWLVARLRAINFGPVNANTPDQKADVGDMMAALGVDGPDKVDEFAVQIGRFERDLMFEAAGGDFAPPYIVEAFREAVELSRARAAA